jgi:hypothetical protein
MLWTLSYINDITLVTHDRMRKENAQALEAAARTAFTWATNNAVAFGDSKSELLHIHPAPDDTHSNETNITLPNGTSVTLGTKEGRNDMVSFIDQENEMGNQMHCLGVRSSALKRGEVKISRSRRSYTKNIFQIR